MVMTMRPDASGDARVNMALPRTLATQRHDVCTFPSGMFLQRSEFHLSEPLSAPFFIHENECFFFGFQLTGCFTAEYLHQGKTAYSYPKNSCMLYTCQGEGIGHYAVGEALRFLSVCMDQKTLHELLGDAVALLPSRYLHGNAGERHKELQLHMSPGMQLAAHQAMQPSFGTPGAKLYMESKVLELLVLFFHALGLSTRHAVGKRPVHVGPKEQDMLHAARDILCAELDDPPSIAVLSRRVGVNDFKLKQLFKQYFNTTIYGYVQQERMRRAKDFLEAGMTVSQAATALGYVNYGHFAAAFRKYHGVSPSAYKR